MRRRIAIAAGFALAALTGTLASTAGAQAWPNRPVRIIVPYAAGQGTDVAARLFAEQLAKTFGQSFVIDNRPGAGGNIGAAAGAKAAPDGYTFTMGTNATHAANQFMYSSLGFDPETESEPVALTGMLPMVLSVAPGSSIDGVPSLIAAARAKPDSINVALPSTTARIVLELFKQQTGAPLFGVAYKGSSQAMTDLMGGQVQATIDTVTATRPQSDGGKIRPLAITSAAGGELLPGVKSVAEQGVKGFEITAWNAMFAPKGTPPEIVRAMGAELVKIIAQPEVRQKLMQIGIDPRSAGPEELGEFLKSERRKWGGVIQAAKIRAE